MEKILTYIPYFEKENQEYSKLVPSGNGEGVFPSYYFVYDEKLEAFIKELYDSNVVVKNYTKILGMVDDLTESIPTDSEEVLRAKLTYIARAHRFGDEEIWDWAAKEKVFLNILNRLKELWGKTST